MITELEEIIKQVSKNEIEKFPEMAVQTLLEIKTYSDYAVKREQLRIPDDRQFSCVQYEMSMFEEDELSILENEYKSYIGLNSIVRAMSK